MRSSAPECLVVMEICTAVLLLLSCALPTHLWLLWPQQEALRELLIHPGGENKWPRQCWLTLSRNLAREMLALISGGGGLG